MIEPTHEDWQAQVTQLAATLGWKWLHVRRSIGRGKKWVTATNVKGWPDLTLWNPRYGGLVFAELKVGPDKPSADQIRVLDSLEDAGLDAFVWRPEDLPEITRILDRRPPK